MRVPPIKKLSADSAALPVPSGDPGGTVTLDDYDSVVDRLNALQVAYDVFIDAEIAKVKCNDPVDAERLRDYYDSTWFANSQFSDDALAKLASALLDATESFSPGYALWVAVYDGQRPVVKKTDTPAATEVENLYDERKRVRGDFSL